MPHQTPHRYDAICDASPDAILLVDTDGRITFANARVTDLFSYEPEELVGERIEVLVPEAVRDEHVAYREAYVGDPDTRPMGAELELTARRADGSTFPVDVSLSPLGRGEELEVMAAVRDVTERATLRTKYRSILQAVPDAVVIADAATGEIVEANDRVADLFGHDPEALVGAPQTALHPDGEAARYRALFETLVRADDAIFTQFPDGSDVLVETATGETVPVEINAQVFELNDRQLVAGVFRDVADRRAYERQLASLHETTRDLLAAADDAEIAETVAGASDTILGYERTVVRLVDDAGRLRPAAVTDRARAAMGPRPDYHRGDESPVSHVYETGDPVYFDDVDSIQDERDRGAARSAMYLPMGEHGVVSVVDPAPDAFDQSDIELASILAVNAEAALDRLADEREIERQNERLEEFASVVSHDLRNPLAVAQGWLDAAEGSEELERVQDALDRMDEIIGDTLTLARQGRTVGETERLDLGRLARDCWRLVSTGDAELDVDGALAIHGDQDRVRHLLENLFRNAIDHGGDAVTVTVGPLDGDGFFVADDGPGVPPSERETVFEPGHTTAADGTGLGLTIVREIARAHGWSVRVTDATSGGARVEFHDVESA